MTLHRLGFFQELPHGNPEGPSLYEREALSEQDKERVIGYLRSGAVLAATQTVAVDPMTSTSLAPLQLLTDGEWVWYNDLAYYVQAYDVRLDPAFLRTIAGRATVGVVDLAKAEEDFFA